jgi:protein phosphatase
MAEPIMEEITAEFSSDTLAPSAELKVKPVVTVACKTDIGRVREINQDKFEYFQPEDPAKLATRGLVFLVCDGMGGHAAGQVASELALKTFIDVYLNHPADDPAVAIRAAVQAANRFVLDNARAFPARRGMGTTLTGVILIQDQAYVVNVGDSRTYRTRGGELVQLTHDHTYVDELIRAGVIGPEEARTHPQKNVITRAIGIEGDLQPDIFVEELQEGDSFMMCSDGIINHVTDEEVGSILTSLAPAGAAWKLVGQALIGGGTDNATAMIVRVDALIAPSA